MSKAFFGAAVALIGLAACDAIPFLQGGKVEANGSATANAAGNASAPATVADAGVTSSRSLAGLTGGQAGNPGGGKDPSAIQASSGAGAIDPRLIGSWSDNGTCKDAAELRADGSFVANNGAQGRWSVEGSQLVFTGAGGVFRLRLDSIEADRIVTTTEQGQTGQSIRC